jgi:hypothetical protein
VEAHVEDARTRDAVDGPKTSALVFPAKFAEGANSLSEMDSKFPTAKHEAQVLTLEALLATDFATDAHFVSYVLVDPDGDLYSRPVKGQRGMFAPRVNKPAIHTINNAGWRLLAWGAALDWDLKDNLPEEEIEADGRGWTQDRIADFNDLCREVRTAMQAKGLAIHTVYKTTHGARFIHRYDQLIDVEEHERILEGLRLDYLKLGLKFDEACRDWTRMMRAPRVLRDNNQTWTQEWFSCGSDPDAWTITSLAPRADRPKAAAKATVPMYEGNMPTPEECIALFEEPTGRGGTARKTELYKCLKTRMQRIDDPHLYAALVHQAPYPFEHGQVNTDMTRVVGSLCGRLYGEPYMTGPEPIFAILLPGAEELPTDNEWIKILWSMCVRMWTGEAAQYKAKEIEAEKAEEEQRSRIEELLDNLRALYPSTPIDQAWAMQHAIAKKGRDHYLLRLDGTYGTMAYEESTLPNAVRDSGMEFLVRLEEMRGKSLVYLSGRELVKMHGFSLAGIGHSAFASGAVLRFEGAGPTLVLQAYQRRRIPHRFHQEVDVLLRRSFGAQLKLFYLWAGEALAFDETGSLPLLLVIGKTGGCKTLVTAGLGHAMAGREVVKASKASQRFNAALLQSPIVHHEEEFHTARGEDSPAQAIRTMIGGSALNTVERKGRDVGGGLEVQLRVIVTMNSKERAVRTMIGDQDLEPDDIAAVARRVLVIETEEGVDDWLEDYAEKHGRRYTDRWLEDDKLPEHLLWCYENRDGLRGELEDAGILPPNSKHGRFLLPSNAHDLFRAQDAESEVPDGLLCSVAQMFTSVPTAVLDSGSGEALRCGSKLLLLTGPLVDRQVDDRFGSTRKRRVAAVDRLCSSKPDIPWRPVPGAKKSRWRELDTEFVFRLLVARGFEDVADDLAAVRGEPDPVTDQGAA